MNEMSVPEQDEQIDALRYTYDRATKELARHDLMQPGYAKPLIDKIEAWQALRRGIESRSAEGPLRQRIADAAEILRVIAAVECHCDVAYTARGRHEPNSWHADYEDEIDAAKAWISESGAVSAPPAQEVTP